MEKYYKQYDSCRQNERPFCSQACPFHMDVLDFQSKMAAANYNAAYKTFRNACGFPDIVAALCPESCALSCPRGELDKSVQLNLLEKTCVARATKKNPTEYNVPLKEGNIAVIGGGISGLACALRLAQKKYKVTIYEKTDRTGGSLRDILPSELYSEDIQRQLQFENYTLHLEQEIQSIDEIRNQGFHAIYIATGKAGNDFGLLDLQGDPCRKDGDMAVFAGGSLTGKDKVNAIAQGLEMAWSIEVFLKTGKLEYPKPASTCLAVADPDKLIRTDAVIPTNGSLFTDEEAMAEAARCIRCQCDACMKYCDVCDFHKKWPIKIREDILATVAFSTSPSMLKRTPAKRLMNTCTGCGLCDEVCPEHIEIGGMLMEARKYLHRDGTMPGAYHQFWIRDMEFAGSQWAALAKRGPGEEKSAYAFFPGCQLGAADPDYVYKPYKWLLSRRPDTGLILRCCSVPAEWAGDEELRNQAVAEIRHDWEKLGKPVLILACASCIKQFEQYLPEIETTSLYEILDQWGKQDQGGELDRSETKDSRVIGNPIQTYSLFDPCSARHKKPMQEAVRNLAGYTGLMLEELPKGDLHGCCGYGGQGSIASAEFSGYVTQKRGELSENPYLVYCINCRDVFKGAGKPAIHILNLLFGIEKEESPLPGLSRRRRNRVELKEKLLAEIWGLPMEEKPQESTDRLKMSKEVQEKMNGLRILDEDVSSVIQLGETKKRRVIDPGKGTYICYGSVGEITLWVEYRPAGDEYEVVDVYSHRMKIKLEAVWNGRKTEIDL